MSNRQHALSGDLLSAKTPPPLAALCAGVLPVWAKHLATSRKQSEVAVAQMLQAFAQIAPHMPPEQVERMHIGFQYQDRASQMMALLEGDIARLHAAVLGDNIQHLPDAGAWLQRLESQYVMAEQHHVHSGEPPPVATDVPRADSNKTTFF